jgi:hypothetical protein
MPFYYKGGGQLYKFVCEPKIYSYATGDIWFYLVVVITRDTECMISS